MILATELIAQLKNIQDVNPLTTNKIKQNLTNLKLKQI